MEETLPLPDFVSSGNNSSVTSVNGKIGDVELREVIEYKDNAPIYNLSNTNVENHVIYNTINSSVILPYNPMNGFVILILNYGSGKITIMAQDDNIIETFGNSVQLVNYLDKIKLLFNNNIWNII
jgi:hypothetical protein